MRKAGAIPMKPAALAVLALAVSCNAFAEEPCADPALFNGKDLTGWTGTPGSWAVREGALVGRIAKDQLETLWSKVEVKDFYLSVEVRLEPQAGGAAICFRARPGAAGQPVGYRAEAGKGRWGRL